MDVLDLLYELNEQGRTIVMVLHDLNHAARYAHHIVALREGQIRVQGTPTEVMTAEHIHEVFGLHTHIIPDPITDTPMCIPIGRRERTKEDAIAVSEETTA